MTRRVAKYGRLGPLYEFIPRSVYVFARNVWLDLKSIPRRLSGRNPAPEPWMVLHNFGGGDFYKTAEPVCREVQRKLGFDESAAILDVGCGTGRLAWPLAEILSEDGRYIGFDVSAKAIAFAKNLLKKKRPDFTFIHADLYSGEYNPRSKVPACDYRFPCEDAWADAIVAISVFTHLLEEDARQFLKEIKRCMKSDGRAYVTAYLIDDEVRARLDGGEAQRMMQRFEGPIWAGDLAVPEAATGYDEDAFMNMVADAELEIEGKIFRGGWSLPVGNTINQDVFVLRKRSVNRVAQ